MRTAWPYNAIRDLVPVIEVAEVTNGVTVHRCLNFSSLKNQGNAQATNDLVIGVP